MAQPLLEGLGMKAFAVVLLLAACTEHGQTPPGGDPPALPTACEGHCIIDDPGDVTSDICCDSVTCFLDEETNEWVVTFCDPPPPLPDPCETCSLDQICVQTYDGTCNLLSTACVEPTAGCTAAACTFDCDMDLCGDIFTCSAGGCGTESPSALHCYGP